MRAVGVAVVVCLLFVPRVVRADTLVYEAIVGCPARDAFVASVVARTPLAHFEEASRGRAFRVALGVSGKRDEGPYLGTLAVTDEGKPTTREIDGATCDEVADAMALVVALAIDPNAKTEIPSTPTTTEAPPIPLKKQAPVAPSPPPSRTAPAPTYASRLALEGVVGFGVAPSTTLGAGLDVGVERTTPEAAPGLAFVLAGHARASFEKTVFTAAAPSADTIRAIGVLSLCPLRASGGPIVAELCGGLGVGLVRFEGEGAANPSAKMRFWSHVEGALVTTIALGRTAFVGVRASLEAPLTRDELVFVRPEIFVHRAAAITGNVGVFVGLRL